MYSIIFFGSMETISFSFQNETARTGPVRRFQDIISRFLTNYFYEIENHGESQRNISYIVKMFLTNPSPNHDEPHTKRKKPVN